jgi:HEAT repeat protein
LSKPKRKSTTDSSASKRDVSKKPSSSKVSRSKSAKPVKTMQQKPNRVKLEETKAASTRPVAKKVQATVRELPPAVFDEFMTEIRNEDQQVSFNAVDRLGRVQSPRATELLIACLKDTRYMIRLYAAVQLGERRDVKAVESLIDALHDESLFVRQTAAGALENIGGSKAMNAVKQAEDEGLLLDELPEGRRLEPDWSPS